MGNTMRWGLMVLGLIGLVAVVRGGQGERGHHAVAAKADRMEGVSVIGQMLPIAAERSEGEHAPAGEGRLGGIVSLFPVAADRFAMAAENSEFPSRYFEGLVVREGGAVLRQQLVGGGSSELVREGNVGVYRGVQPGVDALMMSEPGRTEEFLRIAPGAASQFMYEFRIESASHTFKAGEPLAVVDSAGKSVMQLDEAVYWVAGDEETRRAETSLTLADVRTAILTIGIPTQDRGQEILLDPSWSLTGSSLISPYRAIHTTTLLPNGKVLAVGGYGYGTGYLDSSELYDPSSGTWSAGASMRFKREGHAATLMSNGKVLVTGGDMWTDTTGITHKSCESYDPAANRWSRVSPMATARVNHTATLLADGRVLVAGGIDENLNGGTLYASCEIYDPISRKWAATGSLNVAKYGHRAVLLGNGKVLAGGFGSFEIFDPASGSWTLTGTPNSGGVNTMTLLADGRVLVTEGFSVACKLYDPAAGAWSATGSMSLSHRAGTASLLADGKVLVAGGVGSTGVTRVCELYDPSLGTWTPTASLIRARYAHRENRLLDGKVLISGGGAYVGDKNGQTCELYTP